MLFTNEYVPLFFDRQSPKSICLCGKKIKWFSDPYPERLEAWADGDATDADRFRRQSAPRRSGTVEQWVHRAHPLPLVLVRRRGTVGVGGDQQRDRRSQPETAKERRRRPDPGLQCLGAGGTVGGHSRGVGGSGDLGKICFCRLLLVGVRFSWRQRWSLAQN